MQIKAKNGGLDNFRMIAALLVITVHTSPLSSINDSADFFLTRILARVAVPFFFMVTGQFVVSKFIDNQEDVGKLLFKYLKKLCLLYGIAILIYIPIGIYAGHYAKLNVLGVIRMLVFDGTFYHLWYFPACILGVLIIYGMSRLLSLKTMTVIAGILYFLGLLGDSYYGLIEDTAVLGNVYNGAFEIFSYTRNGLFFAPIFLLLGGWMNKRQMRYRRTYVITGFVISFVLMTVEGFVLYINGMQRHDSMYIALIPVMIYLYQIILHWKMPSRRVFRNLATWIYILHPAMIVVVRMIAKILHLNAILVENSLIFYAAVTVLSVIAAGCVVKVRKRTIERKHVNVGGFHNDEAEFNDR